MKQLLLLIIVAMLFSCSDKKETNEAQEPQKPEAEYFIAAEEMPSPIGGLKGIQEKITYPEEAQKNNISGRVFVKAFINENGGVDKVEIIKGIGYGCDEVALDAIKATKFKPAMMHGKGVKSQVAIPIVFKLDTVATDKANHK